MKFQITGTVTMNHGFTATVEADDEDAVGWKSWSDFEDIELDDDDDAYPNFEVDEVEKEGDV